MRRFIKKEIFYRAFGINFLLLNLTGMVFPKENFHETELMAAAFKDDMTAMQNLIANGRDVNGRNDLGMTALMFAAGATPMKKGPTGQGGTAAIKLLLDHGAEVNATANMGTTALILAVDNGNPDSVELLITHNADVNLKTSYGATALIHALMRGYVQIATLLLDSRSDVNGPVDVNGETPLMIAIDAVPNLDTLGPIPTWYQFLNPFSRTRNEFLQREKEFHALIKTVNLLLDRQARVDVSDKMGRSPITLAATKGHALIVKALLMHGADINIQDGAMGSATALILAAEQGNVPMTKALLEKHPDVMIKDNFGKTALQYAVENNHQEIIKLLKKAGAE